jgi:hypothetical protein
MLGDGGGNSERKKTLAGGRINKMFMLMQF